MSLKEPITKLIQNEKSKINNEYKNNKISYLEAHNFLKQSIYKIYSYNNFYYEELINRKLKITELKDTTKNILISLIFGILGGFIIELISKFNEIISFFNPYVAGTIAIAIYVIAVLTILYAYHRFISLTIKGNDFNTSKYELSLIEEQIKYYEEQ